jgi:hypothetical protein
MSTTGKAEINSRKKSSNSMLRENFRKCKALKRKLGEALKAIIEKATRK